MCSIGTCIFIISEKAHDLNTCQRERKEWKDTTLTALQLKEKHFMSLVHILTERGSVSCRLAPAWHPGEHPRPNSLWSWTGFFLNGSKFISEKFAQRHTPFYLALALVCLHVVSGGERWRADGITVGNFLLASSEHGWGQELLNWAAPGRIISTLERRGLPFPLQRKSRVFYFDV